MSPKIKSSTYPAPQTFNEWQAFLKEQRDKAYRKKLGRGNEDLIRELRARLDLNQ